MHSENIPSFAYWHQKQPIIKCLLRKKKKKAELKISALFYTTEM